MVEGGGSAYPYGNRSERITRKRRLVLDEDVRAALCPASSRELEIQRERESATEGGKEKVYTHTDRRVHRTGAATTVAGVDLAADSALFHQRDNKEAEITPHASQKGALRPGGVCAARTHVRIYRA